VLARSPISYYNFDELIEDNVSVHTRIHNVEYGFYPITYHANKTIKSHLVHINTGKAFWVRGYDEIYHMDLANTENNKHSLLSKSLFNI